MELGAGGLLCDWNQCQPPPKMSPPNYDTGNRQCSWYFQRVLKILIIYSG